jgi:hypothetical protein
LAKVPFFAAAANFFLIANCLAVGFFMVY